VKGCFNKYVFVNLSTSTIREYPIPEEWYKKYLGGEVLLQKFS